jgi:hypothetical protein
MFLLLALGLQLPSPRIGAPIFLDDDSDDAPSEGRNKGRPNGKRHAKLEVQKGWSKRG